jgi:uncharacterized protein involved in response to NO
MAEPLRIGEAAPPHCLAPQWPAFLELGFRPLYLAGCAWAAVSVAVRIFAPHALTGRLPCGRTGCWRSDCMYGAFSRG